MRIQRKEFVVMQHFGDSRDIPQMPVMTESVSMASLSSEMSDSVLMENTALSAHG